MRFSSLISLLSLSLFLFLNGCGTETRVKPGSNPFVDTSLGRMYYEDRDGLAIVGGDMILGKTEDIEARQKNQDRGAFVRSGFEVGHWPGSRVPYVIDRSVTASYDRQDIAAAIAILHAKTSVRFVPRTTETDYVSFEMGTDRGACYSYLGRIGRRQPITLSPGRCTTPVILHEIGHALGLIHEHQRPDRGGYITVHPQNISPGRETAFAPYVGGMALNTYDVYSIMQYPSFAFSRNGQPTLLARNGVYTAGVIPYPTTLSPGDVVALNSLANRGTYHAWHSVVVALNNTHIPNMVNAINGLYWGCWRADGSKASCPAIYAEGEKYYRVLHGMWDRLVPIVNNGSCHADTRDRIYKPGHGGRLYNRMMDGYSRVLTLQGSYTRWANNYNALQGVYLREIPPRLNRMWQHLQAMSVAVNAGRTADVNYYASQLNQENEGIWAQWDSAWKTWSKRTVDSMSEIANHTHALKGNKEWTIGNSYNAIINSAVYSHANYNRCPIRSQRWHYPYLNWWENTVL